MLKRARINKIFLVIAFAAVLFFPIDAVFACGGLGASEITRWTLSFITSLALDIFLFFLIKKRTKVLTIILFIILLIPIFFVVNNFVRSIQVVWAERAAQIDAEKALTKNECIYVKKTFDVTPKDGMINQFNLNLDYSLKEKMEELYNTQKVETGWYCPPKLFKDEKDGKWYNVKQKESISLGC